MNTYMTHADIDDFVERINRVGGEDISTLRHTPFHLTSDRGGVFIGDQLIDSDEDDGDQINCGSPPYISEDRILDSLVAFSISALQYAMYLKARRDIGEL